MSTDSGQPRWQAILLDLDGTLVDDRGALHPENVAALRAAAAAGAKVVVATGRSELSTQPVLLELDLGEPAIVFNGAGVWCPRSERFLEERTLSDRLRDRAVRWGLEHASMTVTMCAGRKFALRPRRAVDELGVRDIRGLEFVDDPRDLLAERTIRVTLFSDAYESSGAFSRALGAHVAAPAHVMHFPLNALADHRESPLHIVDLQAPCRGKGEAVRWLHETYGIEPARVVAVGDARNDLEMFAKAGLAVAMQSGMPEAIAAADRVIGDNNGTAIAELVAELFLGAQPASAAEPGAGERDCA